MSLLWKNASIHRSLCAALPLWLKRRWWRIEWAKARRAQLVEWKAALVALRGTGNWQAIPTIMHMLVQDNDGLRNDADSVISELAVCIPLSALPGLDQRLRCSTYWTHSRGEYWDEPPSMRGWHPQALGMMTMHPSGYVREAALRQLVSTADIHTSLPFVLLRLNDWVSQVRNVAADAVRGYLATKGAEPWIRVLGLLDRLRHRSRVDNSWLEREVSSVLLRPESRQALEDALRSTDRGIARLACRVGTLLPDTERAKVLRVAMENSDSVVRLQAATAVRTWKECPNRQELLQRMAGDRFMPVRLQAIYASLDFTIQNRQAFLLPMLLDHRESIRHAARYYLREAVCDGAPQFDARSYYLNAIKAAKPRQLAAAVAGLGECGNTDDIERLRGHGADPRPSVAAAAVRGIARLGRDAHMAWFVELLRDERPLVAREAARTLLARVGSLEIPSIRKVLESGVRSHSRRCALRVLLRQNIYDATIDAIFAIGSNDPDLVRIGSQFVREKFCGPLHMDRAPRRKRPCSQLSLACRSRFLSRSAGRSVPRSDRCASPAGVAFV